jgi:hypothetical protein
MFMPQLSEDATRSVSADIAAFVDTNGAGAVPLLMLLGLREVERKVTLRS